MGACLFELVEGLFRWCSTLSSWLNLRCNNILRFEDEWGWSTRHRTSHILYYDAILMVHCTSLVSYSSQRYINIESDSTSFFKLKAKESKCNIAFLNLASLPIASFEAHNVARARCDMLHEAVPAENAPRRTAHLTPSQPNRSARPHSSLSVDMASSALPVRPPHAALIAVCLALSLSLFVHK